MKTGKLVCAMAVAAALSVFAAACASDSDGSIDVTSGTVIRNATVVNTRDGSLAPGMAIVVKDGRIDAVVADSLVRPGGGAQVIDASGKFVVPGFLDMHTHALAAAAQSPTWWPAMIANGITGIREMAGSAELVQRARQLNADSAAGRVDAPEIVQIPGTILGGPVTAPAAVQLVRQQNAYGADFVKTVGLSRDALLALLAEAKNQGLTVAGHLGPALSATDSSRAGWHSIEHLGASFGMLIDCSTDEAAIRQSVLNGEGAPASTLPAAITSPMLFRALDAPIYQRILDSYDSARCQALHETFVRNDTWHVPTLIRLRTMYSSNDALYRTDPNLAYVDRTTRALWESLAQQYDATVPSAATATFQRYYALQKSAVRSMKQAGVKMMTGSDVGGIWVIPGFGLHQEFQELAAAGLTPLDILQMATLNAAQFLGRESTMGTVEQGKEADLVLLDANPIADVASLSRISAVFLNGKHFSKEAIDQLKRTVAQAYASQPLRALETAVDPGHID